MKKRLCYYLIVIMEAFIIIVTSCKKDNVNSIPEVSTIGVAIITPVSASCSGTVTFSGSTEIFEKGMCWSRIQSPLISDNKTTEIILPNSSGFTSNLTALLSNTNYFVRAYATNKAGTGYGNELSFTTPGDHSGEKGTVTDIEKNVYQTIGIGSQIWTMENMRTITLNDGTDIPIAKCYRIWNFLSAPGYCWYDNDEFYKNTYGALYNWYTVNTMKLCPSGWHVPGDDEWTILDTYLGGRDIVSVLTWLLAGYRGDSATFLNIGEKSVFWTSTRSSSDKAIYRALDMNSLYFERGAYSIEWGASVRCVKD
jgi:uncharacterized protein (TIGR02145 family)